MDHVRWDDAIEGLSTEYEVLDDVMTGLTRGEMLEPSGCKGWTVADLIFHMLLDAERALVTFSSPAEGAVDTSFATYWKGFSAEQETARAHVRFVRISAAAHSDARAIVERWSETARAAVRRARETRHLELVTTQDHILTTPDFIATLVCEATVHHLDLTANLKGKRGPTDPALALTTCTIEGLLERERPANWDRVSYILKTTGRASLTSDDRRDLGDAVARLPAFS